MGVTAEKKIFHIVPGGHTDPITGKDCKWNTFRVCNTTAMDAAAITKTLVQKFGKRFFFITPDYAYGHTLQENFVKNLKALGGEFQGDMLPIASTEFSATLIKAKAYKPNVILNNMGGTAQINCMKQYVQFGMAKEMALGGSLFEIESAKAVPKEAQAGWWCQEWYWQNAAVPAVKTFVDAISPAIGKKPTARHWMAYVSLHAVRLAAEAAKSLDGLKMAHALGDLPLPPEVSLMSGDIRFRAGDHQLMSNIFVGEMHPPEGDPDALFKVEATVTGEQAAGTVADTGCKMVFPS
jgi:branched-chain amino acid transport system substrate-binding protein